MYHCELCIVGKMKPFPCTKCYFSLFAFLWQPTCNSRGAICKNRSRKVWYNENEPWENLKQEEILEKFLSLYSVLKKKQLSTNNSCPLECFKMASPIAVQRLFSTQIFFVVDPPSIAYGRSKYDKKTGVGPFVLELFTKNEKIR